MNAVQLIKEITGKLYDVCEPHIPFHMKLLTRNDISELASDLSVWMCLMEAQVIKRRGTVMSGFSKADIKTILSEYGLAVDIESMTPEEYDKLLKCFTMYLNLYDWLVKNGTN